MDFHSYRDTYAVARGLLPEVAKMPMNDFFLSYIGDCIANRKGENLNQLRAEYDWCLKKKPYYRIWPSITSAFLKVDLDRVMTTSLKMPKGLTTLGIYFGKGHELPYFQGRSIQSILLASVTMCKEKMNIPFHKRIDFYKQHPELIVSGTMVLIDTGESTADMDYIKFRQQEGISVNEEMLLVAADGSIPSEVIKLVCTVMLLEDDPDLISADVLSDDRARFENGDEELRKRLSEKAQRRGKIGWDVGKVTQTNPHYRHPHFAIRWTGKGKTIPRLTHIKGSFVKREKMLELPTGYEES